MALPKFSGKISIFYSTIVTFHSPSDVSGITGMHQEHIWATPSWRNKTTHYDCIFVNSNPELDSMHGLEVAHVITFFSFVHEGKEYLCAFIYWFSHMYWWYTEWRYWHVGGGTQLHWQQTSSLHYSHWYDLPCCSSHPSLLDKPLHCMVLNNEQDTWYLQQILCQQVCWSPCICHCILICAQCITDFFLDQICLTVPSV